METEAETVMLTGLYYLRMVSRECRHAKADGNYSMNIPRLAAMGMFHAVFWALTLHPKPCRSRVQLRWGSGRWVSGFMVQPCQHMACL